MDLDKLCGNSVVRRNLLTIPGYVPTCPRCLYNDFIKWNIDRQQFICSCSYKSDFESEFVQAYINYRINNQYCEKCGVTVSENKSKYCGRGDDKDNQHRWVHPKHNPGTEVLKERRFTLSRLHKSITLQCNTVTDAIDLYDFLEKFTAKYNNVDEFLNEIENFSTRKERLLEEIGPTGLKWVIAAFNAARE